MWSFFQLSTFVKISYQFFFLQFGTACAVYSLLWLTQSKGSLYFFAAQPKVKNRWNGMTKTCPTVQENKERNVKNQLPVDNLFNLR